MSASSPVVSQFCCFFVPAPPLLLLLPRSSRLAALSLLLCGAVALTALLLATNVTMIHSNMAAVRQASDNWTAQRVRVVALCNKIEGRQGSKQGERCGR